MTACFVLSEIVKVEQPEDYEKETWQMEDSERIQLVPQLKERGNTEFKKKNFAKAAELYSKAIGILEQLMLKWKLFSKISIVGKFIIFLEKNRTMKIGIT